MTPKGHFEINWPLVCKITFLHIYVAQNLKNFEPFALLKHFGFLVFWLCNYFFSHLHLKTTVVSRTVPCRVAPCAPCRLDASVRHSHQPDCLANSACCCCLENLHTCHYGRNCKILSENYYAFVLPRITPFLKPFCWKIIKKRPHFWAKM